MFAGSYFPDRFFPDRYFPGEEEDDAPPQQQETGGSASNWIRGLRHYQPREDWVEEIARLAEIDEEEALLLILANL